MLRGNTDKSIREESNNGIAVPHAEPQIDGRKPSRAALCDDENGPRCEESNAEKSKSNWPIPKMSSGDPKFAMLRGSRGGSEFAQSKGNNEGSRCLEPKMKNARPEQAMVCTDKKSPGKVASKVGEGKLSQAMPERENAKSRRPELCMGSEDSR